MSINAIRADITTLAVDAIVNAANKSLHAGGGVCGAIHRAAGRALEAECLERYPDGCETGDAVITGGHDLPARHVIHAVGPVWRGGESGEDALLTSAYRRSLEVLVDNDLTSIAFPAISTGIYGFPSERASKTAVATVREFVKNHPGVEVTFCCFNDGDRARYGRLLD